MQALETSRITPYRLTSMKSVGKQLQDARLSKNWTPELAARETKIKADRIRDLEADDYTHFTSPAYARGFVRTYARSLGLDEYKILRQLDHKLPDDETPSLATESGVAYLPETSMPPRVAHRNYAGLYVVMGLGALVTVIIAFVLFQAYRVGELPSYFAQDSSHDTVTGTNTVTQVNTEDESAPHALPVDPLDTSHAPKAEAVDLSTLSAGTNAAPQQPSSIPVAPIATTAALDSATNAAPAAAPTPPRALPVDPSELAQSSPPAPQPATPTPPVPAAPVSDPSSTDPNSTPKAPPRALPVDPSELNQDAAPSAPSNPPPSPAPADAPAAVPVTATSPTPPATAAVPASTDKPLILTASRDSFVQVVALDPSSDKPLYASVLHSGQSVGFDGRKFSVNVGISSAVGIKLDGVNYGPHSTHDVPESFTLQSHLQ